MIMNERWIQIKRIFARAVELNEEERATWIRRTCSGDSRLREEVESLLKAHHQPGILDETLESLRREALKETGRTDWKGECIGRYRILQELGHGGMGSVYLAERADGQYRQQVALKIMRNPLAGPVQIQRFKQERQILASLEHDHIARLLDGGVTPDGLPYYVMELIDGFPIDEYCKSRDLNLSACLELFLDVCDAVQYAHRRLIIHRDLKPSNILITQHGSVKLLDFGIAQVLSESLGINPASDVLETPLTPGYASPEQLRKESITTTSDVWQLGLVLHELLAGDLPENNAPEAISPKLPADLQSVVQKALHPEPSRRYESAAALAEDIRRFLHHRPVHACSGSVQYRTQKFLRRHPAEALASALILILVVGYIFTITRHSAQTQAALHEAREEAAKAEQMAAFLTGMFETGDPYNHPGDTVTARTLLDRGIRQADSLADQPAIQTQMYSVIGHVYIRLGEYEKAYPTLKQALALRSQTPGDGSELARNHYLLGTASHQLGRYREADSYFREALRIYNSLPDHRSADYASTLFTLANMAMMRGTTDSSAQMHQQALEMHKSLPEPSLPDIAAGYHALGQIALLNEDLSSARNHLRKALHIYNQAYAPAHPAAAGTLVLLAELHQKTGNLQQAERLLTDALEIRQRHLGNHHTDTGFTLMKLADFYRETDRPDQAYSGYRQLMKIIDETGQPFHPLRRPVTQAIAQLYTDMNDPLRAEPLFREALHLLENTLRPGHPRVVAARSALAGALISLNRHAEAEQLLEETLQLPDTALTHELRRNILDQLAALAASH